MLYLQQKIQHAIKVLQDNEPDGGYLLSFSGGKDSVVIYHLAQQAQVVFHAQFFNTGIEHQETYKFIRIFYPDMEWLNPRLNFFEGILKKGLPSNHSRWCCDKLKKCHITNDNVYIVGIRTAESWKRKKRYKNYIETCHKKNISKVYPVLDWVDDEIWEYIKSHKLPINPLYAQGYNRVGCIACPLCKSHMAFELKKNPKFKTRLIKTIDKFLEQTKDKIIKKGINKGKLNYFHRLNMTAEQVYNWYTWDGKTNPAGLTLRGLKDK